MVSIQAKLIYRNWRSFMKRVATTLHEEEQVERVRRILASDGDEAATSSSWPDLRAVKNCASRDSNPGPRD